MGKRQPFAGQTRPAYLGQALSCDTDARFQQPESLAFLRLWQSAIPAGCHIPSRKALPPELLREYLPRLVIVDMDAARERYRFRLIGTEVVAATARDSTGRWLDDLFSPADMLVHHQAHQWAITHLRPVRVYGTLAFVDRSFIPLEAVVAPVSVDRPDYVEQFLICLTYGDAQRPDPPGS